MINRFNKQVAPIYRLLSVKHFQFSKSIIINGCCEDAMYDLKLSLNKYSDVHNETINKMATKNV
jgi:hypothetical protein